MHQSKLAIDSRRKTRPDNADDSGIQQRARRIMAYEIADREVDDIGSHNERRMAERVLAALTHPNCPAEMFDFEKRKLARHIALRLMRMPGRSRPHVSSRA